MYILHKCIHNISRNPEMYTLGLPKNQKRNYVDFLLPDKWV